MSKIAYGYYGPPPSSPWQHRLVILDNVGNELYNAIHSSVYYGWNQDAAAMDRDGNIFITGKWVEKLKKLDNEGNTLIEIDFSTSHQCAIAPNGDFWTYDWIGAVNYLHKRNPDTLAIIDTITINSGDYVGMAFDADGFLYTVDWSNKNIEKWNVVTKAVVASRALPAGDLTSKAIYSSLAVVGSVVFLTQWSNEEGDIFTCPTDLSADFTANDVNDEFPEAHDFVNLITAYEGTHIIVEGLVSDVKTIVKYTTDFTKVWEITVTNLGSGIWITACPFVFPPTVTTQAVTEY